MTQTTKGFAKQTEMLTTRVLTQTTALPTINVKATPSNAKKSNTSKPKEELSATKLLHVLFVFASSFFFLLSIYVLKFVVFQATF
jgi:hypothetical protein